MTTKPETPLTDAHFANYPDLQENATKDFARTLETENARLRAELEEVRKDAERYRWLQHRTSGATTAFGTCVFQIPQPKPTGNIMKGSVAQHLSYAIDAALATQSTLKEQEG